jgi:AraC-like DNA-binding protein
VPGSNTPPENKLNTPNHWARAIAETLNDYGENAEALFESIGMDYSSLSDKEGFYLQDQVTELWNAAAKLSADPLFGLKAGYKVQSTSYPALGYALMASETFHACCLRMIRFQNILAEGLSLELKKEHDLYVLIFNIKDCALPPSIHAIDAMFSSFLNFIVWLTQKNISPVKASLQRKRPLDEHPFDTIFACPINYSEARNCLYFSSTQMDLPLATADEAIASIHDAQIIRQLESRKKGTVSSNVRNLIIDQLPSGEPKLDVIADHLNISVSTLKRRLRQDRTSFKQLLDETRCQLAVSYLQQAQLNLSRIAELLGFSEPSGFNRAFKRWKGVSPKQWQFNHSK